MQRLPAGWMSFHLFNIKMKLCGCEFFLNATVNEIKYWYKDQRPSFFPLEFDLMWFFNSFLLKINYTNFICTLESKTIFELDKRPLKRSRAIWDFNAFKRTLYELNAIRIHDGDAHVCILEIRRFFWHKPFVSLGDAKLPGALLLLIFHIRRRKHTHTHSRNGMHKAFAITKTNHIWQFVSTCAKVFTRTLFILQFSFAEIKLAMA